MRQLKRHESWQSERGFTLPEVLVAILLMGILFAIASSTWFGLVESRRVDSATNQVVSDLRLAHTRATNRLTNWRVEFDLNTGDYRMGPCVDPCAVPLSSPSRSLEEGTKFQPTEVVAVVFKPDGAAQIYGIGNIKVAAADGSPCRQIEVNTVTSRIKVSSNVC